MPFTLPSLRALARHAAPSLIEGTIAPIALFYLGYASIGLGAGLAAALAVSYLSLTRRVIRRERVPGLVLLSALALTARTALAFVTGSAFVYFLQPTLGTLLTGLAFLGSAGLGRPLTERLSHDLVRLPAAVTEHPAVRRLHVRLSVLWAVVLVANALLALWLLVSSSIGLFLVVKTVASLGLIAAGIGVSVVAFRRCLHRHAVTAEATT